MVLYSYDIQYIVRMAEWSKALRSGRSPLLWAWVRIPLLTNIFPRKSGGPSEPLLFIVFTSTILMIAEWRSGSVLGP